MSDQTKAIVVAIDGPAASGKSTVARRVAEKLNLVFVNSGAMYRAFTWQVLAKGVLPEDSEAVIELLGATGFQSGERERVGTISVDGNELGSDQLSASEVNDNVSVIAAIPAVRERLVSEQRNYAASGNGVVMEGRDIGSVVFPDATAKFYIDASPEVRAQRRKAQGIDDAIEKRDRLDSNRKTAPLAIAEDAVVIDSSFLGVEEVVGAVFDSLSAKGIV